MDNLSSLASLTEPTPLLNPQPLPSPSQILSPSETQPIPQISNKRPKLLSILLFLSFGDFIFITIKFIALILILTLALDKANELNYTFSIMPFVCIFPIFTATITLFVFYLFLKTKDLSTKSLKLLSFSYITILLFYIVFMSFGNNQLQNISLATGDSLTKSIGNPLFAIFSAVFNEVNIISILILIVTRKNKTIFTNLSSALSIKQKILLIVFGLIILLPTLGIVGITIYDNYYPDTELIETQNQIGHKLYSPKYIPKGMAVTTEFYIADKGLPNLSNPTVRVALTLPLSTQVSSKTSKSIVMNQTLIPENFVLLDYLNKNNQTNGLEEVVISNAKNKTGYMIITPEGTDTLKTKLLYFVTTDNILINLATPSTLVNGADLLNIAESIQ